MKITIFSDIHLEHYSPHQFFPHISKGDVLILAGDILCAKHLKTDGKLNRIYRKFLDDCSRNYDKIFYVMGNHEHYGFNYKDTYDILKKELPSNFHLLENETITYNNWNFIGFTLWTDFQNENALVMMESRRQMSDYHAIRNTSNYRKLLPEDTLLYHKTSKSYLLKQLKSIKENVFIISHHSPSWQSISPQYRSSMINGAFCSDLDDLIITHSQIKYFVHGHLHNASDYMIGDCRVICNPVGYPGQVTNFRTSCLELIEESRQDGFDDQKHSMN